MKVAKGIKDIPGHQHYSIVAYIKTEVPHWWGSYTNIETVHYVTRSVGEWQNKMLELDRLGQEYVASKTKHFKAGGVSA